VFLTGFVARQLGAGKYGQSLTALSMAISPLFLAMHGFFSMNPFEIVLWTAAMTVMIIMVQQDIPKLSINKVWSQNIRDRGFFKILR